MCCLTLVKTNDHKIVITHNRDEQWSRQSNGSTVNEQMVNGKKIWMPKDSLSNGTWIGTDGTKAAAILNGFKENHLKKVKYLKSRGTIIPQFLLAENSTGFIDSFDPSGLEPFTLILVDNLKNFIEYGWDEKNIHLTYHSFDLPIMFSSATLYDEKIQDKRKSLFHSYIQRQINSEDFWQFHETKGVDHGNFINVDYNNEISTVAISQIVLGRKSTFQYQSLLNNNRVQSIMISNKSIK